MPFGNHYWFPYINSHVNVYEGIRSSQNCSYTNIGFTPIVKNVLENIIFKRIGRNLIPKISKNNFL